MSTSSFYFDSEPERMTVLARSWWFAAIVSVVALLCCGVGLVLWITLHNQPEATTETSTTTRPEQKLLNRKQLDEVVSAYEERAVKSRLLIDTPLKDPSK